MIQTVLVCGVNRKTHFRPTQTTQLLVSSVVLLVTLESGITQAEDSQFAKRLQQGQSRLLADVAEYITANPDARDAEEARAWLFENCRAWRMETIAAKVAREYLTSENTSQTNVTSARQVNCIAQARNGQITQACSELRTAMKGISIRNPEPTVRFALDLAAEAQIAGDYSAARHVLDETSTVFFLNQFVRRSFESRIRKIELCGKPAPSFSLEKTDGSVLKSDQLAGKVVLIDFWATNCAPCLEELPGLQRLYKSLRNQGFEIIGLSLDEDSATLEAFVEKKQIEWPIIQIGNRPDGIRSQFRVDTIPATFLIAADGKLIGTDLRGANLERAIRHALRNDAQ